MLPSPAIFFLLQISVALSFSTDDFRTIRVSQEASPALPRIPCRRQIRLGTGTAVSALLSRRSSGHSREFKYVRCTPLLGTPPASPQENFGVSNGNYPADLNSTYTMPAERQGIISRSTRKLPMLRSCDGEKMRSFVDDVRHRRTGSGSAMSRKLPARQQDTPLQLKHLNSSDCYLSTNKPVSRSTKSYFSPPFSRIPLPEQLIKLDEDLDRILHEIHQTAQSEFNVNSPKQVSTVLFGSPGKSTNKEALEGVSKRKPLARLILKYRTLKARRAKLGKQWANRTDSFGIRRIHSMPAPAGAATSLASRKSIRNNPVGPLLLMDTSAFLYRARFSMPPLHRSDGLPVGIVFGFCNMINRILLPQLLHGNCPCIILAMDSPGPTFRHKLYSKYKANRHSSPIHHTSLFYLVREAAEAYGLTVIEKATFEADDVIATLARQASEAGVDVNILSGDKDLMQLVTNDEAIDNYSKGIVQMIDPMSMACIDHAAVVEKWGVSADRLGDVLALTGDTVDNIPGVPGIGPKTAASLINKFGSLDALLGNPSKVPQKARRHNLKSNALQARLSRKLIELDQYVPVSLPRNLCMDALDIDKLFTYYDKMEFVTMKKRVITKITSSDIRGTSIVWRTFGGMRRKR